MKSFGKILSLLALVFALGTSCKEPNEEAQDVGSSVGNGDMYNDPGSGGTEDHPGQNIGSGTDSTTVDGEEQQGTSSNY